MNNVSLVSRKQGLKHVFHEDLNFPWDCPAFLVSALQSSLQTKTKMMKEKGMTHLIRNIYLLLFYLLVYRGRGMIDGLRLYTRVEE